MSSVTPPFLFELIAGLPCGVVYAEPLPTNEQLTACQVMLVNPAGRDWLGLSDAAPLAEPLPTGASWLAEPDPFGQFTQVVQTGVPTERDYYFPNRDRWASVAMKPLHAGVVITFTDSTDARQAQQQFAAQTALLTTVIDQSPTGLILADPILDEAGQVVDFRYRLTNHRNASLMGMTLDQMHGQAIGALFPGWQQMSLFETFVRVYQTGEPVQYTEPYNHFGLNVWQEYHFAKRDESVLMTFLDVTALKEAELAQQRQTDLLQSVLDTSPAGLVLFEAVRGPATDGQPGPIIDFVYRLTNPANAAVTGFSVAQMTGRRWLELIPQHRDTPLVRDFIQVVDTGQPCSLTIPVDLTGQTIWVEGVAVKQGDGVLFTFLDITALKQAEQAQQQQAGLLSQLLDGSLAGHMAFKAVRDHAGRVADFRYELINQTAATIIHRPAESMLGGRLTEHFPGVRDSGILDRFIKVLETGQTDRFIEHYNADGLDFWFEMQLVKWDDGLVQSYADITPLKRAEAQQRQQAQALETANIDLKRSNEYLQQFAYVASHDLQEPLRKINTFGNVILEQYAAQLPDPVRDMLRRMQNAAERMSELVRDLLTYSRLTTEQHPFLPVSLTDVVSDVLSDQELAVQERSAEVIVEPLPTIRADAGQMRQLFGNLIGNALKFVRPGQPPVIRLTSRRVSRADVPTDLLPAAAQSDTGAYWEIQVSDNGIGFDEKYLDRLFGMFQRLNGRSQYEGSGMGLAICRRVTDNHHGALTARSQPGQGSTFLVYLPA